MDIKFSVIIPVYNREKIVGDAIESALQKDYDNFEIICIDDGSTDGTLSVLLEYEKLDPRVRVLSKENGGVSSARNKGLEIATGEYILFLDSDDRFCAGIYASINACLQEFGLIDVLVFGYVTNNGQVSLPKGFGFNKICSQKNIYEDIVPSILGLNNEKQFPIYCHGKAYNRKLFNQHKIKFDERLITWEDGCFLLNTLKYTKSILFTKQGFYELRDVSNDHLSRMYYIETIKWFAYRSQLFEELYGNVIDFDSVQNYKVNFNKFTNQIMKVIEAKEDPDFTVIKSVLEDRYIIELHRKAKVSGRIEKIIVHKIVSRDLMNIGNFYIKLYRSKKHINFFKRIVFKLKSLFKNKY